MVHDTRIVPVIHIATASIVRSKAPLPITHTQMTNGIHYLGMRTVGIVMMYIGVVAHVMHVPVAVLVHITAIGINIPMPIRMHATRLPCLNMMKTIMV